MLTPTPGRTPATVKCRSILAVLALALASFAAPLPAHAAADKTLRPDREPDIAHNSAGMVETGSLQGTPYRIDIPNAWNHALVVYFHGYSEGTFVYRPTAPLNEQTQPLFDRGYAIIQSAYSTPGWALAEAYPETEQLRLYFLQRYGQPAQAKAAAKGKPDKPGKEMETFVAGGSMGGALVAATLEINPRPYSGGLDLCGSVGPTDLAFQRRFAWRAAFDFYFPNLLPPLVPIPSDFRETNTLRLRAEAALTANPAYATALRNLMGLHTDREVAAAVIYYTYVLGDIQRRAHGNPFDNRNFLYSGTNPTTAAFDNLLNDGVRRYAADPRARDYLLHHYTPSGRLQRPMLALHTTYDPRIPIWTLPFYAEQVAIAGFSQNLVQQYVHRDGHCTFTADEIGHAFDELVQWTHTTHPPPPGLLPNSGPQHPEPHLEPTPLTPHHP